jgi:S-layer protein (TIGR01567 family)
MVMRGYTRFVLIGLLILGLFCGSALATASVTNLVEDAVGYDWINWTWTNPSDADFNHTMVYIDNIFKTNVSNSTNYYNATGFSSDTTHIISTHTVNLSGTINSTWVNDSATTLDNIPPLSITGLNESSVGLTSIKWTWTNPSLDYDHTMIFLNGSFIINVTTDFYENTSLSSGTTYEISTHTVDASNNINTTWVNDTATTNTLDSTPPASITALSNTPSDHWIEWTWTKPDDLDLNHTMIYIEGVFKENVTYSVEKYNYTGIASSTSFEISTKTVDTNGNINATWVNNTATTLSDTTAPSSVTGLTASDIGIDWIEWTWTNPSDADFNHTVVLIDDGFAANVSNTTTSYNATGLTSNTNHTIKLQTVDITGNVNSLVISDSVKTLSKTYYTGDRIWNALVNPSLEYTWTAESFSGFYYDLDSGSSSETMTIKLDTYSDRSISSGDLEYTTEPINTKFEYANWGSYQIIGFMAERYFAGYKAADTTLTDTDVSLISSGQMSKVLMNEEKSRSVYAGSALILEEGYTLNIVELDKDGNKVYVTLTKDGSELESTILSSGKNYIYKKDLGSADDVPIIAVYFDEMFQGHETSAVFVKGIFQISDEYITIKSGDNYGKMEVDTFSAEKIEMSNDNSSKCQTTTRSH